MEKTKETLQKLWYNTRAVDSWILENINFFRNGWDQKVMVGSVLLEWHVLHAEPDIIRYDRCPGYSTNNDQSALFIIEYYADHCRLRYPHKGTTKNDTTIGYQSLEYAEPCFFDRLDAFIWNARTLDYINSDLEAIKENAELIKSSLLTNPMSITKRIGSFQRLLKVTGEWEAKIRRATRLFCDENETPTKGIDPVDKIGTDTYDDVPF